MIKKQLIEKKKGTKGNKKILWKEKRGKKWKKREKKKENLKKNEVKLVVEEKFLETKICTDLCKKTYLLPYLWCKILFLKIKR